MGTCAPSKEVMKTNLARWEIECPKCHHKVLAVGDAWATKKMICSWCGIEKNITAVNSHAYGAGFGY
eukprot:g68614.t1